MSKRSPRLQFSDEERTSPELKKVIEKADKKADKLDKAEAKIPKKTVKRKERVVGEDGKVSVKLHFEEVDKKKPTSKLSHSLTDAPLNTVLATAHREVRDSEEDNVGVEGAHKLEQVAEGGVRTLDSAHRSHKLKPYREAAYAEKAADKANLKALNKQAQQNNPQFSSNPYSRWQQKRAIKKEYMAAKAGKTGATTAKATQKTAKTAKKAAENTKKTGSFLARHWKGALIVLALLLMIAFLSSVISSCSVLVQSGVTSFAASSYAADDADMLAVEEQYCALEAELQEYLDTYEDTHDYDEYHYDLDDIEHDPYVLISAISALHGGEWMIGEVGGTIEKLIATGFVERKKAKKTVSLVPAQTGVSLITVLPEQLQSPLLTAEWEHKLKMVERGELDAETFMAEISLMVNELIKTYSVIKGAEVLFPSGRDVIGKCPRCGGDVTESKKGFFCETNDCRFGLWRDNKFLTGKKISLSKKMAATLLKNGRIPVKGIFSEKTGKSYDATLVMTDDGTKTLYSLDFGK